MPKASWASLRSQPVLCGTGDRGWDTLSPLLDHISSSLTSACSLEAQALWKRLERTNLCWSVSDLRFVLGMETVLPPTTA